MLDDSGAVSPSNFGPGCVEGQLSLVRLRRSAGQRAFTHFLASLHAPPLFCSSFLSKFEKKVPVFFPLSAGLPHTFLSACLSGCVLCLCPSSL